MPFNIYPNFRFRLFSRNPANYEIVVGDHNRNTNEGTEEQVGATQIISHRQYNNPRLSSDITLIKLAQLSSEALSACKSSLYTIS